MENWRECKLEDIIEFNPKETIQKGSIAKKIEMSQLIPFCRDVIGYTRECAIKSMGGSSGRQRVQLDVVKNLEISCPSYTEQQKIAKLLRLLDDEIELKRQINANLLLLFLLLFVCCFFFWCSYFFSR